MILSNETYYTAEAETQYMSVSQLKAFLACEAAAMAQIRGEWMPEKTTALMVGSYVDAYFEGTLPLFVAQHPELFKRDGTLKADYEHANQIISRIESDPVFMEYLQGDKQTIMTAEMFGCKWKAKMDVYHPERIVDLKIMRSLERVMGKSFISFWGYDIQLAVYQKIVELNIGVRLPVFLAVATKEEVTDIQVISIDQWRLDECLEYVAKKMPRITNIKKHEIIPERCETCNYCKLTKKITLPISFDDVGFSTAQLREMRGEYH